uniref:Peptidase MA-like domain-containing protein n=1 Tax=uncultured bacterium contig00008 TaxID=1181500 RepID=A0A806JYK0_9BACT|nr:hypothetical protein [uncultured bacterium contig00008]
MKNIIKILGITAIIAVTVFAITACASIPVRTSTESEHFRIFYYEGEDIRTINMLLGTFEDNYERITSALQVRLSGKSDVYVYPDLKTYHNAIGRPQAPDWSVGAYQDGVIRMVSPDNPGPTSDFNAMLVNAVHEFVHLVADKINRTGTMTGNAPIYLGEGVATFLAGQGQYVGQNITPALLNNNFPSMAALNSLTGDNGLYDYGYAFVQYVVSEYGYDGLINLYKNPNIQTVFNINSNDFRENWIQYLKDYYLKTPEEWAELSATTTTPTELEGTWINTYQNIDYGVVFKGNGFCMFNNKSPMSYGQFSIADGVITYNFGGQTLTQAYSFYNDALNLQQVPNMNYGTHRKQ